MSSELVRRLSVNRVSENGAFVIVASDGNDGSCCTINGVASCCCCCCCGRYMDGWSPSLSLSLVLFSAMAKNVFNLFL